MNGTVNYFSNHCWFSNKVTWKRVWQTNYLQLLNCAKRTEAVHTVSRVIAVLPACWLIFWYPWGYWPCDHQFVLVFEKKMRKKTHLTYKVIDFRLQAPVNIWCSALTRSFIHMPAITSRWGFLCCSIHHLKNDSVDLFISDWEILQPLL